MNLGIRFRVKIFSSWSCSDNQLMRGIIACDILYMGRVASRRHIPPARSFFNAVDCPSLLPLTDLSRTVHSCQHLRAGLAHAGLVPVGLAHCRTVAAAQDCCLYPFASNPAAVDRLSSTCHRTVQVASSSRYLLFGQPRLACCGSTLLTCDKKPEPAKRLPRNKHVLQRSERVTF